MKFRITCLALAAGLAFEAAAAQAQEQLDPKLVEALHDRLIGKQAVAAPQAGQATAQPPCTEQQKTDSCGAPLDDDTRIWSLVDWPDRKPSAQRSRVSQPPKRRRPDAAAQALAAPTGPTEEDCSVYRTASLNALNLCLTFAFNSSTLDSASTRKLDHVVAALSQPDLAGRKVVIEGFADGSGSAKANLKLSSRRAEAALAYLAAHGVSQDRLSAQGFGATRPLPNLDPRDGANRRVEARLVE